MQTDDSPGLNGAAARARFSRMGMLGISVLLVFACIAAATAELAHVPQLWNVAYLLLGFAATCGVMGMVAIAFIKRGTW